MEQIQINQYYEEILNKAIKENKISNWKINTFENKKSNIYIQKNYKVESILNTSRKELVFTIYKEFEDQIGESSFTITESDNIEKFESDLKDAMFICSHAKNKKYWPFLSIYPIK